MSGARLIVDADLAPIQDAINRVIDFAVNPQGVLSEIGDELVLSTQERMDAGQAPDGSRHKKPSHRDGIPLVDGGDLRRSITRNVFGNSVVVGSNSVYAAIHQFGGIIKPKNGRALVFEIGGKTVFARQVKIPARPFIGLSNDDEIVIRDVIADYIDDLIHD